MLARAYTAQGKNVLVVDTDESNFGLHRQLGAELPKDFIEYYGGRTGWDAGVELKDAIVPRQIPQEYLSEADGVHLMAIGKIHEEGEGCACAMGTLARDFLGVLQPEENDVVIVDTEAGIEHFGRGIDRSVDVILMVVDPSYESLKLSGKTCEMADGLGKPFYIILNKVLPAQKEMILDLLPNPERLLTAVPSDNEIATAGLKGQPLQVSLPEIDLIRDTLVRECA